MLARTRTTEKVSTRHPCQNFIKYLIITKQDPKEILDLYDLPYIPPGYLDYLKLNMPPIPNEFDLNNKYHKPTKDYLKLLTIYTLAFPDKYMIEAQNYLTNFEVRPLVQDFLLARMRPIDIAKKINAKTNSLCTEEGIDRYRHFFWNTNLLKIEDWSKLFANPSERNKITNIIKNGAKYASHKHGFMERIEAKELLKEALGIIYFDLQDWKNKSVSSEKTKAISTIIHDAGAIDDRLSSVAITMKETLKQFEAFRTQHIKAPISPIMETAPLGNYSGSGMLLESSDVETIELDLEEETHDHN